MMHADVRLMVLYVTGDTTRSAAAIANLHEIEELLNDQREVTAVDVLEYPELAKREEILATPILMKVAPPSLRWLIGDLSGKAPVLSLHNKDICEITIDDSGLHIGKSFRNVAGILAGNPHITAASEFDRLDELFRNP